MSHASDEILDNFCILAMKGLASDVWAMLGLARDRKAFETKTMMDIKVILDSETIAAHGNGFDGEELDKVPILYVFPVLWTVCNTLGYAYYIQLNTAVTFRWLCCLHL